MPTITVYTDPLQPGICQMPVFTVGDSTAWTLLFNNGSAYYDPGSVSVRLGYVTGLENISYPSAFRFVDRLNFQSVGSFSIAAGVPGSLTWDTAPSYIEGMNGAYLIRGMRSGTNFGSIRTIYPINPNLPSSLAFLTTAVSSGTYAEVGAITITDQRQMVVSGAVTNPGSGYTSQPTVNFSGGGGGTGAAATAIINGQGFVTAIVITNQGSGYLSTPTISITGGGGSSATGTVSLGQQYAMTAIAPNLLSNTNGTAINPATQFVGPASGATNAPSASGSWQLSYAGFEVNQQCFVRDPVTLEVLTGVTCTPVWNGRYDTSGNKVYDDALLLIHPRTMLTPSFSVGIDGFTYTGTMDPVTAFIKATLRYRRSATMDIEIFGAGRLLYTGSLTVLNAN